MSSANNNIPMRTSSLFPWSTYPLTPNVYGHNPTAIFPFTYPIYPFGNMGWSNVVKKGDHKKFTNFDRNAEFHVQFLIQITYWKCLHSILYRFLPNPTVNSKITVSVFCRCSLWFKYDKNIFHLYHIRYFVFFDTVSFSLYKSSLIGSICKLCKTEFIVQYEYTRSLLWR